jgi:hypothetical protein
VGWGGGVPAGNIFPVHSFKCVYLGAPPVLISFGCYIQSGRLFSCVATLSCDWLPVGHVLRSGGWWWVGFREGGSHPTTNFLSLSRCPPTGEF